jgi:predicted transcriptional regulator of viral defense system
VTQVNFADLWDELLSEGKSSFTVADLVERTGATPNAVYGAAKYAFDRKRLFSPVRGLYVVVPPEHRSWGVTPATHFIDPMMRHLGIDYYVAFASAAQWWGAAHQAPQEFQVVTDRRVRDRDIERVRLRFYTSARIDADAVRRVAGPRTMMKVATPDLCAVDLASRPRVGGGLSNTATILAELPDLDGERLARLAARRARPDARRLGWLLELVRSDLDLTALRAVAQPDEGRPSLLASEGTHRGDHDERWGVIVNATVEADEL